MHAALAAHERALNAAVEHPLMRELALPYPLLVGRVAGGDVVEPGAGPVEFEGRLGVPVGGDVAAARAALEAVVAAALDDGGAPAEIGWTGGSFAPPRRRPTTRGCAACPRRVRGRARRDVRAAGVPWGADMRHFTARGIPCTMAGTPGIELAHAVDERVALAELASLARSLVRVLARPLR